MKLLGTDYTPKRLRVLATPCVVPSCLTPHPYPPTPHPKVRTGPSADSSPFLFRTSPPPPRPFLIGTLRPQWFQ